jgi:hypothetical protein
MTDGPIIPDESHAHPDFEGVDPLDIAEVLLQKLGEDIGDPTAQDSHAKLFSFLIGHRATSLYANFLYSLTSPAAIAPILALRPLVEAAILAKWISLNPSLHGDLWFAHAEDRELTAIREQEKHLGLRVRGDIPAEVITESVEDKTARRDDSVSRGKDAGKRYGDRPMPHIDRMVLEIEEQEPGHHIAMRQAYDLLYRSFSPWMHTELRRSRPRPKRPMTGSPSSVTCRHIGSSIFGSSPVRCSPTCSKSLARRQATEAN